MKSKQLDLIILKGGFSTCETRYNFEIKSDGTGTIFYSEYGLDTEDFWHESDLAALKIEIEESVNSQIELQSETDILEDSELENIRREITAEKLEEFFWDERVCQSADREFFKAIFKKFRPSCDSR